MRSVSVNQFVVIVDGELYVNGQKIPPLPNNKPRKTLVQSGNRIFLNGYELVDGKWKRTLRAILEDLVHGL